LGERAEELGEGVVERFPPPIPGAGCPTRINVTGPAKIGHVD